ncbi:MAG: 5-(carboxyamino)imidazole ribonucleotide synthase [Rhodovarius sp.]|nr:5-(carboxyamino)imidazole ribonucleotide synthase [Rhodovarius sp.]MDW8315365.1 5-(carboxyamino)imidazole ribonucleotide synthase [Rhodovarius sp.]
MTRASSPLPRGAVIGMVGGGQLGRMTSMAAARLGYRTHILSDNPDDPAMDVAWRHTRLSSAEDAAAIAAFAAAVDVITFETENLPLPLLALLEAQPHCRPSAAVVRLCGDRAEEKRFLQAIGVPTAPWAPVATAEEIEAFRRQAGGRAIVKTCRSGYDGKGQMRVADATAAARAAEALAGKALIAEAVLDFTCEVSVVLARDVAGRIAAFDVTHNLHREGILRESRVPAPIAPEVAARALAAARRVAEGLDYVGIMALEMFVMPDGAVLANEIAPRPHNSGHWTMDACAASQFEQHVRAICGLPLADPTRHADAVMENLIGPEGAARWEELLAKPRCVPHWYGKAEARPGRKLGHATTLAPFGTGGHGPRGGSML